MVRSVGTLLVSISWFLWTQASVAQVSQPPSATMPSQILLFTAVAKDSSPVELNAIDLELREDGKPTTVAAVRKLGRLPLHYCLVFDMSGSAKGTFEFQQQEANAILTKIIDPAADQGWISLFNDTAKESQEVKDPQQIEGFISRLTPPTRGGTALYDAMAGCARRMAKGTETQLVLRTMFVFSDGGEDASLLTLDQTVETLTDTGVHVVVLTPKSDVEGFDKRRLGRLLKRTGGRAFTLHNEAGLQQTIDQLTRDLSNTFELSYIPSPTQHRTANIELKTRKQGVLILAPEKPAIRR